MVKRKEVPEINGKGGKKGPSLEVGVDKQELITFKKKKHGEKKNYGWGN